MNLHSLLLQHPRLLDSPVVEATQAHYMCASASAIVMHSDCREELLDAAMKKEKSFCYCAACRNSIISARSNSGVHDPWVCVCGEPYRRCFEFVVRSKRGRQWFAVVQIELQTQQCNEIQARYNDGCQ